MEQLSKSAERDGIRSAASISHCFNCRFIACDGVISKKSVFSSLLSFQDHIQEVLDKWHQIDDEIWAKLIVMERNRRVAKAYARAIPIQINGSDDGFDGFR